MATITEQELGYVLERQIDGNLGVVWLRGGVYATEGDALAAAAGLSLAREQVRVGALIRVGGFETARPVEQQQPARTKPQKAAVAPERERATPLSGTDSTVFSAM